MPPSPDFSGVLIAGARTRREDQAPGWSAILGGPGRPLAARRGLGGTVGRGGLPLLVPAGLLASFAPWVPSLSLLSILLGTTWAP